MQVQFSLLNYILYRGGFSSSRPCVTANGEQRAPSSFAYALTRTPSLNDIPSRSSFLYSDRVIAYSDDYWFRNKSSNQMPSAAGCSTKVSLVLLGLRHSSTSADTHSQVDLRRSSRLSVRIIRLFQSPVGAPFIGEARKLCFNNFPFRGNPCRGVA